MKIHTTNYADTFIEVAEDCKVNSGVRPPTKAKRTVAEMQYEIIANNPYRYTSDEVLFQIFADRNGITSEEYQEAKSHFFSKGQACLRASPLTKTYGFGVHFDSKGKIAIYGIETPEYEKFMEDKNLIKVKAMRSKR